METTYLDIKLRHLKGKKIFPFTLYIFNSNTQNYTKFLTQNTPLIQAKLTILNITLRNNGRLAILIKDKDAFYKFAGLTDEQMNLDTKPDSIQGEAARMEAQNTSTEEGFHFKDELDKAIKNDNYQDIISQVKNEINKFAPTISHTVSLARYLANSLMTEDNYTNRIAAVSYCFAKIINMKTEDVLADLICAAFFHNIGITQLHGAWAYHGSTKLNYDERKKFMKHPMISSHILKKIDLNLSARCFKIIVEHHERIDGSGYPQGKIGEQIEPLALLLGAISHIFEYSTGRITGEPVLLQIIIKSLKTKSYPAGLEYQFGDTIIETLTQLVDTDDIQKKTKTDDKASGTSKAA